MGGMFGGKAPQSQKTQPIGALNVQTSVYGSAYPLVYGMNRIPINLIDYVNFKAIAHTEKQQTGGKGGGKAATTTTYTYTVALAMGVGYGDAQANIGTIWKNKEKYTLAQMGMTFFNGAPGQTAWSYLSASYPTHAVPNATLAYLAHPAFPLGDSPSLPNINVEFKGLARFAAGTNEDALPSAILTDYLTSPYHGAGFAYLGDLDSGPASFHKYCLARGLFISPMEVNQRQAGAFVKEIAEMTNSGVVWRNGKMLLMPFGDAAITGNGTTYTPDLTPKYALGDGDFLYEKGQPPVKHSEKPLSDQYNHLRMEYNARSNDYNPLIIDVKDEADIDDNGLRSKAVTQYKAVTRDDVARDILQLQLNRGLFVKNFYSFRVGVRHSLLEPMDLLTITEPGLGLVNQLVRIVEAVEQDDAMDIVVEEMNVGTANSPLFNTQAPQGYNQDYNAPAGATQDPLIMNAPGLLTSSGYETWIAACGVNAAVWGGAVVWVSDDDLEYRRVGEIYGPARYGSLAVAMPAGTADYDTTSVARVQLFHGSVLAGTQEDVDDWRTPMFIGGEWVSYRDAVLVSGTTFDLDTFRRAGYGSLRAAHAIGSAVAVIDEAIFRLPYDKGNVGKQIYFKFQSFNVFGGGIQELSDCVAWPHLLGASETTAPMEYLEIAGSGVNLMPDNYSTFEASALPVTTRPDGALVVREAPGRIAGQISITGPASTTYFGENLNLNLTPGKRYIVSAYIAADVANATGLLFIEVTGGVYYYGQQISTGPVVNAFTRVSVLLDMSNNTQFKGWVGFTKQGAGKYALDGIMVEEAIGVLNAPSTYSRGIASGVALSALIAAQSAQATADGQIDIYRQSTAPAIGGAGAKVGDYWQDSDDGKWWYCNGSSWIESPDNRLPQAVIDAATAQSAANTAQTTANARIRLFVQDAQPTGGTYIVGDQWHAPTTKLTRYYNGTGWSLQAEFKPARPSGRELIPNATFASRKTGQDNPPSGANSTVQTGAVVDGWYITETDYSHWSVIREQQNLLLRLNSDTVLAHNTQKIMVLRSDMFAVDVGAKLKLTAKLANAWLSSNFPAGTTTLIRFFVEFSPTESPSDIASAVNMDIWRGDDVARNLLFTVPANTKMARVSLVCYYVNSTGASLTQGSLPWDCRLVLLSLVQRADIDTEVDHGTLYGKTSNEDLYDTGAADYVRRIGTSVKGSRKILGGARNSRASMVSGFQAVRTTTALSADSTGAVTVNAHSVEISGETVAYSAVTNAVTGLTQGAAYVIFTLDPYLDGGTRTYYAQTSVLSAQQAGEGCVHMGNVTIPTSGTSTGGGAGTTTEACVVEDMLLPCGTVARDVKADDLIGCWDYDGSWPREVPMPVQYNKLVEDQHCARIETLSGAAVSASFSTPMTLRSGNTIPIVDMLGQEALVRSEDGSLEWELVTKVDYIGKRTVAKITVHQLCYFAGERADRTIATHNATVKP